ncbi:ROK family transcriptional regulator [Xylanimonas ulmi]
MRLVHSEPGITRTEASDRLSLASGATTELIERLRGARLLGEHPAPRSGPGRPTTSLHAHPLGPLVIVVDLRTAGWRVLLGDLAGETSEVEAGFYGDEQPAQFLPRIARSVTRAAEQSRGRARAVAVVVAGTVTGSRLLQFATRGWSEADLGMLTEGLPASSPLRLLAGNDATLGGLAEARTGAARGARVALHILVAVGVGGVLLVDEQPMTGARGAGGEYGHLPFGDPELVCPCGARGCWDLMVDGRALARHRGDPPPDDPVAYATRLLGDLTRGVISDPAARHAIELVAHDLGAGIAGLVNLHDPELITIAGVAPLIRHAAPEAFDRGYQNGLMTFHRRETPAILDGLHGDEGPVLGALSLGVDEITSPTALARWGELTSGG